MANISTETSTILNATRGEDVRDAIVSAMIKINSELLTEQTAEKEGYALTVNASGKWRAEPWT